MYRLATCFWVSDLHTPTGFVGCAEIRNSYLQDALQLYENINEQIQEDIENLGKDEEENIHQV